VELYDDLLPTIITPQHFEPLAADVLATLVDSPVADAADTMWEGNQWKFVAGALIYKGMIYIPAISHLRG
jgi:hypothetical protein